MSDPLLRVRGLRKLFPVRKGLLGRTVAQVHAVDGVDLDLAAGGSLGLVGESGCGKTTLGRCLLRLIEPTAGSIRFAGQEVTTLSGGALRRLRREMQMVFQDPYGSLNPRMSVGQMIAEPLLVHGLIDRSQARDRVAELLTQVGLDPEMADNYPHQFSGGQRQRIGIARAVGMRPKLLICDEPVSALDVSVQAQVINLLQDLQDELGLAIILIAHDLAVVAHCCEHLAVMYLGEVVELGRTEAIFAEPLHPYTQALLSAIPPDAPGEGRQRILLPGDPPSPMQASSAQRFTRRFPDHAAAFENGPIALKPVGDEHWVRCADVEVLRALAGRATPA